jgi:fluoroquinolone resistance protein
MKKIDHNDSILNGSYYENEKFAGLNLDNCVLYDVEFYNCEFRNVVLINGKLKSCRFEQCSFSNSDLSLVTIADSSFSDVSFENCKLIGINWTKIGLPFKIGFNNCKINDSVFAGMDLRSISIVSCDVHNVDFEKCNMSKSTLTGSDFLNTTFGGANLSFADLTDARNYRINPTQTNIKKAKFSQPEVFALLDPWDIEID